MNLNAILRRLALTICLWFATLAGASLSALSLDGIWESDGYGFILEIKQGTARLFSIGNGYCVPDTNEMVPIAEVLPGAVFDVTSFGQRLSIGFALEPHRIIAHRRTSIPAVCAKTLPGDAVCVFEIFVGYFDTHYPFFELHDVDWPSRVSQARQRVNMAISDQALFNELRWHIEPIRDGNVALAATIDGDRRVVSPGRAKVLQGLRDSARAVGEDPEKAARAFRYEFWYQSIAEDVLGGRGKIAGNDRVQYGMLGNKVVYLAFAAMDGLDTDTGMPSEDLAATQSLKSRDFERQVAEFQIPVVVLNRYNAFCTPDIETPK